jgi:hypothetical protein
MANGTSSHPNGAVKGTITIVGVLLTEKDLWVPGESRLVSTEEYNHIAADAIENAKAIAKKINNSNTF